MAVRTQRSAEYRILAGSPEQVQMSNLNNISDDMDSEGDDGDEGETLLASERKPKYAPMTVPSEESTWLFVRGILLEVSPIVPTEL